MFSFFKKKKKKTTSLDVLREENNKNEEEDSIKAATGFSTMESARASTERASKIYAKSEKYDRSLLDNGAAKVRAKKNAFADGQKVYDSYTGDVLELKKSDAKLKYGKDWQKHLAESDHKIPLEKIHKDNAKNPWLTNDDLKNIANSDDNIEVVSRKYNNAKRSRTNEEFVTDDDYLKRTGVELSGEGKEKAIQSGKASQTIIDKKIRKTAAKNIIKTGHEAGKYSAGNAGVTAATMSGIMNITAVIKGEKSVEDALADTAIDTGKAAATGYVLGGGLTTVSHTLSSSSSKFLQGLSSMNVPGQVITAVMLTGDTIRRYGNGEITTEECIIELGGKGLNFATTGYSMTIGQTLIPIPIVGAAVGALVGSVITSKYYNSLINTLKTKELEHQERLRIMAECKKAADEERAFRAELESYLQSYFREYRDCFDEALSEIQYGFQSGDADSVILGANQITRKLGGKVYYETVEEFKDFLADDSTDIL
ncbi:hypothetical protein [Clostridium perfringens]|uniref:Uncharacterized protein n=2 Tax=Clostridium perfringens TaxID=1502 RepID=A0AAP4AAN8_CLOPF|nr:hypothetical protein [Clostridium perfringens]MDH2335999.1 hypothetical protein [Clostridium perfringens]